MPEFETVLYEMPAEGVARITQNRPDARNAQNNQLTYDLNAAFDHAAADESVKVIILAGAGPHFSAGHDLRGGSKPLSEYPVAGTWREFNKPGAEGYMAVEEEIYLGMCRRWRNIPKPTIAEVQGKCIAGGLMLAWVCDLIVASDDAFFQDPVNPLMGIPGVEYFAHAYELPPRVAKEFLLLGERMTAERAERFGMVNRVVPRDQLRETVNAMAAKLAGQDRLGNWLTKQAVNHVEELRGKRAAMDAVFHMHHFAHAQNDLVKGDSIAGVSGRSASAENKKAAG